MRTVILDGMLCDSKEQLHLYLARELDFPAYYGNNLDAVYDLLTSCGEELHIQLFNKEKLIEKLGGYGETFLRLLSDAQRENQHLTIEVE